VYPASDSKMTWGRARFDAGQLGQVGETDAGERRVENRPRGDAVHVADLIHLRKRQEFLQRKVERFLDRAVHAQAPRRRIDPLRSAFRLSHRPKPLEQRLSGGIRGRPSVRGVAADAGDGLLSEQPGDDIRAAAECRQDRTRSEPRQEAATRVHALARGTRRGAIDGQSGEIDPNL
jgi:hypothetical protein